MVDVVLGCARWGLPLFGVLAMSVMLTASLLLCLPSDESVSDSRTATMAVSVTPPGADPLRPGSGQYEVGGPHSDD